MALNNPELDIDVQHKIYEIQAVEEEPRIWRTGGETRNKIAYFNQIARNMNFEFNTNIFTSGKSIVNNLCKNLL